MDDDIPSTSHSLNMEACLEKESRRKRETEERVQQLLERNDALRITAQQRRSSDS